MIIVKDSAHFPENGGMAQKKKIEERAGKHSLGMVDEVL